MKRLMFFVLLVLCSLNLHAQVYRLSYDAGALPELYNQVYISAEIKQHGNFQKLAAGRYKLSTKDALLEGNLLRYDRQRLYENNGVIHFTLRTGNQDIPVTLQLPTLEDVSVNLYTDSIKPILNYYLNVEGRFSNGRVFPLDTNFVTVTSNEGRMNGLEWILPKDRDFEKVTFIVTNKFRPADSEQVTLYLKKHKDPRDDPGYQERSEEEIINSNRRR